MTESSPLLLPKPFLGVTQSALGRTWVERCDAAQGTIALAIAQTHGLPDVLSRVLAGRGVGIHDAEGFLNPRLRDLMPDPHGLTDMEAAASRLGDAVMRNEKVAIFGDYDVDGACSAALLAEYLRACGLDYAIHIPDRITEGYGPNVDAIRALKEQGADILVTVDCGTASIEPLAEAKRLGLDPIVLDHHQAPEQLPEALAIVNPNRQDDLSGLGHLCAAGVVFLFLVALNRTLRSRGFFQGRPEPDLMGSLDLVALATVADVVPLIGLNRAFVRQGLAIMKSRRRVGLAALLDTAGLAGAPESWHLGYLVGPRINAGGRIGDAALGSRLLLTDDPVQAGRLAAELDRLNRERQAIEVVAVAEAEAQAMMALERMPDLPVLVTASAEWHPGVVGLISARTKERFRRPAFAFTLNADGTATGSGRSVPGVDLGFAVRAAVEAGLAIKGGGHTMAAGVTIQAVDLERFLAFVTEKLTEPVSTMRLRDDFAVDATLTAAGAQPAVVTALERAGPFGQGQPEPVFVFPQHRLVEAREVGSGGHMRVKLRGGDGSFIGGIAFRAAGQPLGNALSQAIGNPLHVAGTLSIDRWGGNEKVEVRIMDAARPE
ncbi:single-stranded-DNA-specific exonuclease RecJ [Microvirga sp. 3-52]|uniref:single-stranded-DNA-specific exonuclease RecJ n=1 Tax=Microvirga sp. 3-52 TaxID=2792425 RepID=UPI001AD39B6A|nr:single-stranded-DNA-specific exonuclease RecJ [Microvirga sp. 3-52]MBO1904900.1 single-stranded-DNA-specific exonuclease RecJ [Microvirga sp. 3-52]MBS7452309.1 single-stranded-DNA-specific exonuclease RecJ [Microvirga sp. 3-52]